MDQALDNWRPDLPRESYACFEGCFWEGSVGMTSVTTITRKHGCVEQERNRRR